MSGKPGIVKRTSSFFLRKKKNLVLPASPIPTMMECMTDDLTRQKLKQSDQQCLEQPIHPSSQRPRRQSMGSVQLHQEALIAVERASMTAKMAAKSPALQNLSLKRNTEKQQLKQQQREEKQFKKQRKPNEEQVPGPKPIRKQISIDITPSGDLVLSLLIAQPPRLDQNSNNTLTTPSSSICSTPGSLATPVSFQSSPRLDDIRSRLASKQAELDLRLKRISHTFSTLDDDLKLASTRSLPAKNRRVPMLSLFVPAAMVHEETEEGAEELDYVEQARQIAEQIKSQRTDVNDETTNNTVLLV